MSGLPLVLAALLAAAPQDGAPLARARQSYNAGEYDSAIAAATEARRSPGTANAAALVLARAHLERFRLTADLADLDAARRALGDIRAEQLEARGRLELVVGLGESLYLDDQFGPAAEMFESALAGPLERRDRERVLDWWATAMDRQGQVRTARDRDLLFRRIFERMEEELGRNPLSATASYWLVASARALGEFDRAWDAAVAGWVRAPFGSDEGVELRIDLDRLVLQALIPERARKVAGAGSEFEALAASMRTEWEQIKQKWAATPSPPSSSSQSRRQP